MNKNSILYLKGMKQAIAITEREATSIKNAWNDENVSDDSKMRVGKLNFQKRDIKFIEENSDVDRKERNKMNMMEFDREEITRRNSLVKQSVEYKASLLDMFRYLYKFSANEFPSPETLEQARLIQLEFFRTHPHRTLCDPYLFRSLMVMQNSKPNVFENGFFRIVEKAVYRDMQLSGQLRSDYQPKVHKPAQFGETIEQAKQRVEENRKTDAEFDNVVKNAVDNF